MSTAHQQWLHTLKVPNVNSHQKKKKKVVPNVSQQLMLTLLKEQNIKKGASQLYSNWDSGQREPLGFSLL